jgi:hypothetical protein
MAIQIVIRRNGYAPIVFCDECGHEIETAADGNYQWHMSIEPAPAVIYFTHKRCCRTFEAKRPAPADGWIWGSLGLEVLPVYLERNLGIDHARAEKHADLMGAL